jgi:hypothetical protein
VPGRILGVKFSHIIAEGPLQFAIHLRSPGNGA